MKTVLDALIEQNEFPVVFIGAGVSKRFLNNFPDWTTLLEEFWGSLGLENFYGEYNNVRGQLRKDYPHYNEKEINHYSNIIMGSKIEEEYNRAFNGQSVTLEMFSPKDAFRTGISPFKKAISERFHSYTFRDGMENEYLAFKKMLLKTQIILTTNYDTFIEDSYNSDSRYRITKYIGQKGFFNATYDFAELYKLHGCIESPKDIVIAENDYYNFEQNSVLISAKIISMMMTSPIIFIGYSLSDVNVRKIIKDFTRSLNEEEIQILENRLVLIEWLQGESEFIEEVINDKDLGCKLKVIKTDNYEELFKKIASINQGIAPTEVRKYQHVIKKLIIDRGKKGALRSVLISPEELDRIEENLQNQNITVAIGDSKYIFQIPDIIVYSLDYISDLDEISNDIRLKFAVLQNARSRFPIMKLLDDELIDNSSLHPSEKDKLKSKKRTFTDFQYHHGKINMSSVYKRDATDLQSIVDTSGVKKSKVYATIGYNIKNLPLNEVRDFIIKELEELKEKGEINMETELRKLILLYDILKNKGSNA
ncbi:SIR2 family protein [Paenibacillus alvei]|uniref:SIR2 family protein n=1 Tax=Paenibacillus alvei TaxID=44250 RepID=UPI00227F6543|nr:SIR2 family protein [Paenibacillus alvei]MCY7487266.1 SIR2 family protein [Paenibacillus alvei]